MTTETSLKGWLVVIMNGTDIVERAVRLGRWVCLVSWCLVLLAAATPGATEEIVVRLDHASTAVLEAAAQERVEAVIWHGERKPLVAPVHRVGPGQAEWVVHHPWQHGHQLVLRSRGAVSLPVVLGVDVPPGDGGAIQLTVAPATRVSGRLAAEDGRLPDWGQVVLQSCRDPRSSRRTVPFSPPRYAFSVSEDGRFDVELPLGCWEPRVLAPGFSARPGRTELVAGSEHRLGEVAMYPAGRVVLEGGVSERRDVERVVRLIPERAWYLACDLGEVLEAALDADYVDARESWVFEGLPPGMYLPVVQGEGASRPIGGAIPVEAGESVHRRLAPEDFASLQVRIEDAEDIDVPPEWSFRLTARPRVEDVELSSCFSEPIPSSRTVLVFEELAPGTYAVDLYAVFREGYTSQVAQYLVDLAPGEVSTLTVRLAGHFARGRVTHRGKPVSAVVYLMERVRSQFFPFATVKTDADGRFTCFLREPGEVDLSVLAPEVGGLSELLVTFPLDGEEVQVELPSGRIDGVVVDGEGREVAGANVRTIAVALPDDEIEGREEWPRRAFASGSGTTTDEFGRFSLEGLDAGRWVVLASVAGGELASLPAVVPLQRNEERGGLRLELHPGTRVTGKVVTASGRPMANTFVGATVQLSSVAAGTGFQAHTDGAGEFEFWFWPGFDSVVDLFVLDRFVPLTAKRVSTVSGTLVQVPHSGGFVRFRMATRPSRSDPLAHQLAFIGRDGAILGPGALTLKEGRGDDGEVEVTFGPLAPGRYRVHWMQPGRGTIEALWAGGGGLPLVEVVTITAGTITDATSRVR